MLHIQRIVTTWNKNSRGGEAATIRNSYPEVLPVYPSGEKQSRLHDEENQIYFYHTFSTHNLTSTKSFYIEQQLIYAIQQKEHIEFYLHKWHSNTPKRILELKTGNWFQAKYTLRHVDRDYGSWYWNKTVLNIHYGETEKLQPNHFQVTKPVAVFDRITD